MKHKWQPPTQVAWHRKYVVLSHRWQTSLSATFCSTRAAKHQPYILINSFEHTSDTSRANTQKSAAILHQFLFVQSSFFTCMMETFFFFNQFIRTYPKNEWFGAIAVRSMPTKLKKFKQWREVAQEMYRIEEIKKYKKCCHN